MRKLLGLVALTAVLLTGSPRATATTYIFATFKGDDAAGMKLSIYTSTDSTTFTLLSDTGFGGNTGYIRDPSIMKYTDGKYYIAYTDPTTASCCNPEDHFGIAVSSDLIHWSDLATVKAGVPNVSRVWAPEWYVEGGVVRIIANIDTGSELPDFEPYAFTAQNSELTQWSGPTVLGIGPDYIDTYVAKLGSTYHAFIKSETTRYLEHATAPSLTGPWTFVGKNDWAGWGSGLEGPAIVQLDSGQYRMYVDPQAGGVPCQTMTSSDLNTWSARASIPGTAGTVIRHGTVIRDAAGLGSNGYFTAAGGAAGSGGATASGGFSGSGGTTGSGGTKGGSTGMGGSSATGGTLGSGGAKGGSTSSNGSTATGGSTTMGGSTLTGGSIATGGFAGIAGGNGGSASSLGGHGGAGTGGATDSGRDTGNADASTGTGGSTGAAGSAGGSNATATPDAEISAGGTTANKDAGTLVTGGTFGAATGGSTSAAGGISGTVAAFDAGGIAAANSSGCSCAVTGGVSSTPPSAPAWLFFGLVALVVRARRRKRK
jgi:MYXO-CTERM domain-containing protein